MTFNEFQRLMIRHEIPENMQMVLAAMFERFGQMMNEHEQMAKTLVVIANNMQQFVTLREQDRTDILNIMRRVDMVRSEPFDPNDLN